MRLPLSSCAMFVTSCISLLAFSVLLPAGVLLILDRVAGTIFFIPSGLVVSDRLQNHAGGSPLLWQHLFWFFGHPEVYIAILPAMGIVSHVLVTSMRKPLLSAKVIIYSMISIRFLSYMVWGRHIFGILSGTYFWFPKMTGRMMNETLGQLHFWFTFIGTYCIFMPFHYLGLVGNVRRYASFIDDFMPALMPVHRFVTIAALITGAAQFVFLYNLIHSRFYGKPATDNPWEGTSLEWSIPSPPP